METYNLNRHLDSAAAPSLCTDLLELRGEPLTVDASAVTFAGTLPVQVLVSAQKQWQEDEIDFAVKPLSDHLANTLEGLGIGLDVIGAMAADVVSAEVEQ